MTRGQISSLSSLQQLELRELHEFAVPSILPCVPQLPVLQHLILHYADFTTGGWEAAVAAAPLWQQLPQLQELRVPRWDNGPLEEEQTRATAVVKGAAAATSLTSLMLGGMPIAELCCFVVSLPRLCRLRLERCEFSREDAFHLTAFTQLKSLSMCSCRGFDDAVAVAVASSLTGLQELLLNDCGVMLSDAPLAAFKGLHGLRSLHLRGCQGLVDSSWQLLARLTQLTMLNLGCNDPPLRQAARASLRQALGDRLHFY